MRDFVRFGKALCPARHTAIVFYSHGDGRARAAAVDGLVTASFAVQAPERFVRDASGASLVLPDGARETDGATDWQRLARYSAVEPASAHGFGRLAWCADGAVFGDGVVQNWFDPADSTGSRGSDGANGWRW
ncbi:MAG: hypothetical protein HZA52_07515 [Planctomycetes bacterium]|nr:hypothetical protein [Planctomycetota bacterium]